MWLICDDEVPSGQYRGDISIISLSSPKLRQIAQWTKGCPTYEYYLPTWRCDELLAAQVQFNHLTHVSGHCGLTRLAMVHEREGHG